MALAHHPRPPAIASPTNLAQPRCPTVPACARRPSTRVPYIPGMTILPRRYTAALLTLLALLPLATAQSRDPALNDWFLRITDWEYRYKAAYDRLYLQYGMQGRAPGAEGVDEDVREELLRVSREATALTLEGDELRRAVPPDMIIGSRLHVARQRIIQVAIDGLRSATHLIIGVQLGELTRRELIMMHTTITQSFEIRDLWGHLYLLYLD